jgi:hypothetical protein
MPSAEPVDTETATPIPSPAPTDSPTGTIVPIETPSDTVTATLIPTSTLTATPSPTATSEVRFVGADKKDSVSVTVVDVSLTRAIYSSEAQSVSGTVTIEIDSVDAGAPPWRIIVQAQDFAAGEAGVSSIPASNLSLTAIGAPIVISGESEAPTVSDLRLPVSLDQARTIANVRAKEGGGVYRIRLQVSLLIPAASRPGTYTGAITVSATVGG